MPLTIEITKMLPQSPYSWECNYLARWTQRFRAYAYIKIFGDKIGSSDDILLNVESKYPA